MHNNQEGFIRGLRACVEMLETISVDECAISSEWREGRPQDNAVRRALEAIAERNDGAEFEGFCAALTEIIACADEQGDYFRAFEDIADRRESVLKRP